MASILTPPRYVCQRCLQHASRQHSTLLSRAQARPKSTDAVQNGSSGTAEGGSRLKITKHWSDHNLATKFRAQFKTTLAEDGAQANKDEEETKLDLSDVRPRGRSRLGRPRRTVGLIRKLGLPSEPAQIAGSSVLRPVRPSRFRNNENDVLEPSKPSAPLGSTPPPKPAPIFAPESPTGTAKLKYGNLEGFNWYYETLPPKIADKSHSNHFFTNFGKSAKLLRSVAQFRLFPASDVPEVAFVGRSNVGKSSLLNAVVNADIKSLLARTSSTPGFTKTMNLYGIGAGNGVTIKKQPDGRDLIVGRGGLTIVDMPGYGEGSLSSWGTEIIKYLQSRKQLRRVFVLVDAQHGLKDKDRSLLATLRLAGVSHQIILSKLDRIYIPEAKEIKHYNGKSLAKLKPKGSIAELRKVMEGLKKEIQPPVGGGALGEILGCSAETRVDGKRLGIDHVRYAVLKAVGLEVGTSLWDKQPWDAWAEKMEAKKGEPETLATKKAQGSGSKKFSRS